MSRSWIKIETTTPHKPEVCAIASSLRLDPDMVVGKLVRLWAWAELNVDKTNATNVTKEFLDRVVGRNGFAAALERAGWLKGVDGALIFPNFNRHNGKAARIRAQTAERVSKHRERKRKNNEFVVTDVATKSTNQAADTAAIREGISDFKNVTTKPTDRIINDLDANSAIDASSPVPTDHDESESWSAGSSLGSLPGGDEQASGPTPVAADPEPEQEPDDDAERTAVTPGARPAPSTTGKSPSRSSRSTRSLPPPQPPEQPLLF